jgi:23S rRNA pseudouridine1911/1915/1917 synthase
MMAANELLIGAVPRDWTVGPAQAGARLDRFLADQVPELSRVHLQRLIAEGAVRCNGSVESRGALRLVAGDRVDALIPPAPTKLALLAAAEIPLTVLHADTAVIVVDKLAGLVVHPARGHADDTLVNALLARYPDLASTFDGDRPGIVHRLDKDTSGVMVVARTPEAMESLKRQFKDRSVDKVYGVLVRGTPAEPEGIIDAPIGRDEAVHKRMATQPLPHGVPAQTRFRVLESAGGYSWVEVRLMTGRTHQIRVHMAAIGHPVAGDRLYGRGDPLIARQALHAWRLAFDHPLTGLRDTYTAPLPDDLRAALDALGIRAALGVRAESA